MRQRCGDVVAVADVGDGSPAQRAPPLPQRHAVGQRLARVFLVGEGVDDVEPGGSRGELLQQPLRERPDDHRVDPALQIARDIGHRLAAAQRGVGMEREDVAAELADRDLEGRTRPQRRLLEEHRDMPSAERRRRSGASRPSARSALSCAESARHRSKSAPSKSRTDRKSFRVRVN